MSRTAWERRAPDAVWKKGDTAPAIRERLLDGTGATVDLTGASVQFRGLFPDAASSAQAITSSAVVVAPPTSGIVSYTPVVGDTDTAGDLLVEWRVTFAGGAIETFRSDIPQKVRVRG